MFSLFPIPRRKLISITSENEIMSKKRDRAWKIVLWSEENINFLFKYASTLLHSQISSELISTNVIGPPIQTKYSNAFSEGILILWNIASILSDSLAYFPINDKTTREIFKERISTILKILYSIQTDFLPSIQMDSKSDLQIQNVAFYHIVYASHYYETLVMIGEKDNENLSAVTLNSLVASKYFYAASKMNPFPTNFMIGNTNYSSIDLINNRVTLYNIKSLISHSNDEAKKYKIGSAIFYLNLALEALNSSPSSFQSTEYFSMLNQEVMNKKKNLEDDNKRIYFCLVKSENPLPEIQNVDEIIHSGIKSNLQIYCSNNEKIKKELNELNELIDKQRKMLINSADSISILTSLLYECDSSRKQINSQIYASSDSNNAASEGTKNEINLQLMLKNLTVIENEINIIFSWISTAKVAHPSSFDIDHTCEILSDLQENLRNTVGKYFMEYDINESEQIISSAKSKIGFISISQDFLDDIAKKTEACFQIMEKISILKQDV